jgi:alginate O-acetyltransferase complex protein AlgI
LLTWVFFRAETLTQALDFLKSMGSFQNTTEMNPDFRSFLSPYFISILIIGLLASLGIFSKLSMRLLKQRRLPIEKFRFLQTVFLILLFYLSFIQLITCDFNPFIYYRF